VSKDRFNALPQNR